MCQTLSTLGAGHVEIKDPAPTPTRVRQPVGKTQRSPLWVRSSGGMEVVCASLAYKSQRWAFLPGSGISNCPGGSVYSTEISKYNKSWLPPPQSAIYQHITACGACVGRAQWRSALSAVESWGAGLPEGHRSDSPIPGHKMMGAGGTQAKGQVCAARAWRELQTDER